MASIPYKAGDLEPALQIQIVGDDGVTGIDLTTAVSVTFKAKLTTGATLVTRAGSFVSRATGIVKFDWVSGDLATIGIYDAEVEVAWPSSRVSTYPNDSFAVLTITRKAQT